MPKLKKRPLPASLKARDPSWKMWHELGHKVEPEPKTYKRREKHTRPFAQDEPE